MLTWPDGEGADLLVDDGGDATLLIHEGVKAEAAYKADGTLPDPASTDNPEFQIVLRVIKEGLPKDPTKWTRMAARMVGVSEETTTGVKRLYEMQEVGRGGAGGRGGVRRRWGAGARGATPTLSPPPPPPAAGGAYPPNTANTPGPKTK